MASLSFQLPGLVWLGGGFLILRVIFLFDSGKACLTMLGSTSVGFEVEEGFAGAEAHKLARTEGGVQEAPSNLCGRQEQPYWARLKLGGS